MSHRGVQFRSENIQHGRRAPCGAERCNADEDRVFVAATPASGTDPFDDQMLYLDRNALVASLGGPGCQTAW